MWAKNCIRFDDYTRAMWCIEVLCSRIALCVGCLQFPQIIFTRKYCGCFSLPLISVELLM